MKKFLVFIYIVSYYGMNAIPALNPEDELQNNPSSRSYLDGYPQEQDLEHYVQYLLSYLEHSQALSTINLALWNQHYDNREQACGAVDAFVKQRNLSAEDISSETDRNCKETYRCDYDRYRFPSTIITVECGSAVCYTMEDNWPARGACLGDQYYLTTLKFIPDTPTSVQPEQVNKDDVSGDGESNQINEEDIEGRWAFQSSLANRGCLCIP